MSTDIYDIYQEDYENSLFKDLNGILSDFNIRSDYPEVISTIFSLHLHMESIVERIILEQMKSKFNIKHKSRLEKLIDKLCFKSKLDFLESLEVINDYFFQYCRELNEIRNIFAHKTINDVYFFNEDVFSIKGFEKIKTETKKALKMVSQVKK